MFMVHKSSMNDREREKGRESQIRSKSTMDIEIMNPKSTFILLKSNLLVIYFTCVVPILNPDYKFLYS